MDIYSISLLIATLMATFALLISIIDRYRKVEIRLTKSANRVGITGLFFAIFALGFHYVTGHAPGTSSAVNMLDYILEHAAPFVVILVITISSWMTGLTLVRNPKS